MKVRGDDGKQVRERRRMTARSFRSVLSPQSSVLKQSSVLVIERRCDLLRRFEPGERAGRDAGGGGGAVGVARQVARVRGVSRVGDEPAGGDRGGGGRVGEVDGAVPRASVERFALRRRDDVGALPAQGESRVVGAARPRRRRRTGSVGSGSRATRGTPRRRRLTSPRATSPPRAAPTRRCCARPRRRSPTASAARERSGACVMRV